MKKFFTLIFLLPVVIAFGQIEGTWKMAPQAAALGVGPELGDISWWSNSLADVTTRACYFDDLYVFGEDGTFNNVQDGDTWIEPWQGMDPENCGAPVAPHDGSNAATWAFNAGDSTVTLTGVGAYLGLAKVFNEGELTDPADAPASITYPISLSNGGNLMTINISIGTGYWRFILTKGELPPPPENVLDLPLTFELDENYRFADFGGTTTEIVEDPMDATNHVAKTVRGDGAETWAGTTVAEGEGLVNPVPFTESDTKMALKVMSPAADIPVLLKIEDFSDNTISVETTTNTTVANEWETIVFDFSVVSDGNPLDLNNSYNKPVVFFNFGVAGADAGEMTFYWDNLSFGEVANSISENVVGQVNIYPNPATDVLNIKNHGDFESLSIYSVTGKLMLNTNNVNATIDISNFAPGLYTISAIGSNGMYLSKFIVK